LAFNRLREGDDKTYSKISSSIQKIRRDGYAQTKTRSTRGISGIAVPVFDRRHAPIGSLCVVSTPERTTANYLHGLVTTLKQEAEILSAQYELARLNPTQPETWRSAINESQALRAVY
jgi:DNA-binding IclR family transcriptional regulator